MSIYSEVSGGKALLEWFGEEPSFHDAEILCVVLNRSGTSMLQVHGWRMTSEITPDGYFVLDRHAVVTFHLTGITDLVLDGFSAQNVVSGVVLRRAAERGRSAYLPASASSDDFEIELMPCYGLDGFIRAREVSISFTPGRPEAS